MAVPGDPQGAVLLSLLLQYSLLYTVPLDKGKYLTPAPNLRRTRASDESQFTRYLAYSDALKKSFFPMTMPMSHILPFSMVSSKTTEEFKAPIKIYTGTEE